MVYFYKLLFGWRVVSLELIPHLRISILQWLMMMEMFSNLDWIYIPRTVCITMTSNFLNHAEPALLIRYSSSIQIFATGNNMNNN